MSDSNSFEYQDSWGIIGSFWPSFFVVLLGVIAIVGIIGCIFFIRRRRKERDK
ncbi:LPXTG-motif cell wall-anchored protein [Pullulanibacillus pueri]|uniref:LPXTG cell wall anchor domain-containing protein n=1 Tax=Pullulanibacillus pueri TaxID=1437324 RepID=A0A8J3EPE0_9BACL|nr:hypothetical protein [Pullulanibacillus pueri]MBM7683388.1 LPXTG-motif cell wall-anchored protein [Pullulanibacillus pueri]GGH86515.1 hypothetical protein GCM10007096_34400 [Pullulanibacillus pueri]